MRVVIVGAGVGGLTLARLLTRAGVSNKVVEALPKGIQRADRGLGIWDAAQAVLRQTLGEAWMNDNAHFISPASYRSESGSWLSQPSASTANLKRVATVRQSDLFAALQTLACVEYGKKVVALKEEPQGVVLRFENGEEEEATLVVGADGHDSALRREIFPETVLLPTGKTCYSAISEGISLGDTPPFETLGRCRSSGGPQERQADGSEFVPNGSTAAVAVVPLRGGKLFWSDI